MSTTYHRNSRAHVVARRVAADANAWAERLRRERDKRPEALSAPITLNPKSEKR